MEGLWAKTRGPWAHTRSTDQGAEGAWSCSPGSHAEELALSVLIPWQDWRACPICRSRGPRRPRGFPSPFSPQRVKGPRVIVGLKPAQSLWVQAGAFRGTGELFHICGQL